VKKMSAHKKRAFVVLGGLLVGFAALSARLHEIQLTKHDLYSNLGRRQHYAEVTVPASRGAIYDTCGRLLVTSVERRSLWADPKLVNDASDSASALSPLLEIDEARLKSVLTKDCRFVWIQRRIDDDLSDRIESLGLGKGIRFSREFKRSYTHSSLCSQVLGFTNVDDEGLEGLEIAFDAHLSGTPGFRTLVREGSSKRRKIADPELTWQNPTPGKSLVLTIDAVIQSIVEEEIEEVYERHQPKAVVCIVTAPNTGHVLAMSTNPSLNPNELSSYTSEQLQELSRNRAITDLYEPGSTFKPITAAACLQSGVANEDTIVDCEGGAYLISRRTLHDVHAYDNLTFSDVIKKSSNIGIAKLGMKLGPERLHAFCLAFGFGNKTGIELRGEAFGMLAPADRWSSYTITSVPMGQEVAVTPLQLVMAYSAIANGGILMRPIVVRQIIDEAGKVTEDFMPRPVRRVIRPEVSRRMCKILAAVTGDEGTGRRAAVEGTVVAGKTGTAQKLDEDGRYSHSKFIGSFVGFAPAENAEVCVLVLVDEPKKKGYYGGVVAAPAVGRIIERSLSYLKGQRLQSSQVNLVSGALQ